jgi:hypothetical protein
MCSQNGIGKMSKKTRSRKTAKKRGGLRRRKTTARRGGAMLSNQKIITVTDNEKGVTDINGNTVKLGDLVEIKGSMPTGTKNDGKYILFSIIDSNVTFVSIPSRNSETSNTSTGVVTRTNVSVHIIKINYGGVFFGYTVTKQPNNQITVVTYENDIYTETSTFDSKAFYDNYKTMVMDTPSNSDNVIVRLPNMSPDSWEVFEQKVKAIIVQKNKKTQEERNIVIKNGKREIEEDKVVPTNAQPTPKEI